MMETANDEVVTNFENDVDMKEHDGTQEVEKEQIDELEGTEISEGTEQIIEESDAPNRGWSQPGTGRFRGRGGFGSQSAGRGRGAMAGHAYRGGRGGGPGNNRFGDPNFNPSWSHANNGNFNGPPPMELWVETKTEDGKSYYYHALTRETTWTKPDGPNIKIMTQSDVEAMNMKQQSNGGNKSSMDNSMKDQKFSKPPLGDMKQNGPQPGVGNMAANMQMNVQFSGPPPQLNQPTPYGIPPPGFPPFQPPWGGAPWQHNNSMGQGHPMPANNEQPAKQLIIKPGVIDPQVIARAAEWSEYRAPDGRPYYYHAGRGESVWEKPQAIRDLEAARMAAHSGAHPQNPINPLMMAPGIGGLPPVGPGNLMFDPMGFAVKNKDEKPGDDMVAAEKKRKLEQEKKKKEDDDKAKQAAAKQQDKSRPVSSTPIAGTPWCVVWTGDGRVFFYNPSTRTSVWERPDELIGRTDVDKAVASPPQQSDQDKENEKTSDDEIESIEKKQPTEIITRTDLINDQEPEEYPNKRQRTESGDDSTIRGSVTLAKPITTDKKNIDIGKEAAMEAEVRAARERALLPLDTRIKSFKEMLKEKDVSAFSTWEKELHKIVFDQRYLLLTSRERKQVFDKYVKERAEEERREKRNKMRQKRDDYRNLMESAKLHGKSSFNEFSQKYVKDERFRGIEKMRERESLFNEFIVEVRRRENEEKQNKKEQTRKDFFELLREHPSIDRHSRWFDVKKKIESDHRYKAIESSILREDLFHEYCKILKEEKKKAKDKNRDKERKEKKSDKKDKHKDKKRESKDSVGSPKNTSETIEQDLDSSPNHEDGEHPPTSDDESSKQEKKERDRQQRAEQSLKEREKEVQMQLASSLRDRDKEREHHKRDEAMRHFSALLADLVRNAELTWKEVKKQLRKDHRWELVENLDREDREQLFNNHIDQLTKKKRDKFREMLEELPSLSLTSSWKDVKKQIRDDPRYLKYSSSDKCEKEFRDYIKDKTIEAKTAFRELLQECKFITYKSWDTFKENSNHMKEIEDILKNDKRYLVLDHMVYDRNQMLLAYMEDLKRRGPPPPPTASESTRRK